MKAPSNTTLDAKIARESVAGTTTLSQKHYAEEILQSHGFWDIPPRNTLMKPNTRLSKDDCDPNPKQDFHRCYRGIVGSLGYLVTMTRPDLAFSYSKLSKYVQFLASHTWRRLNTFYDISVTLGMSPSLTLVALRN